MRNLESKHCETCKKEFTQGYNTSKKSWESQRFCNFNCRRHSLKVRIKMSIDTKNHPSTKSGAENPSWKGGITPQHNNLRSTLPLRLWREEVNMRDENICQECNMVCPDGNRVAHHILELKDRPDLGHLIENGITLCIPCYRKIHSRASEYKRGVMAEEVLATIAAVYA